MFLQSNGDWVTRMKNMDGCRGNPLEGGDMVECVHCNVEGVPLKNI
jgi:hypothetical protein